jgi:hypothetical protein
MAAVDISRTQLRRRQVLAGAMMTIGLGGATRAMASPDLADLAVVDRDSGEVLPVWRRGGRMFVAGEAGRRYGLRVTNRTGGRVLAVMSVDGLNIITGETAGYGQSGYVLGPYRAYDVTGWRKSNEEVAAFSFAPLPQSYAARTGRPADVGVIGMAVFTERPLLEPLDARPAPLPPQSTRRFTRPMAAPLAAPAPPPLVVPPPPPAAPPPASAAQEVVVTGSRIARRDFAGGVPDERLGTAHGAREWSVVEDVAFIRATTYPQCIRQIEYDSYENLVASGVIPHGHAEEPRPRAFPSQPHGGGFVPDPPDDR